MRRRSWGRLGVCRLFASAIMESGSCDAPQFFRRYDHATSFSREISSAVGCNFTSDAQRIPCLRALSTNDLMDAITSWLNPDWCICCLRALPASVSHLVAC